MYREQLNNHICEVVFMKKNGSLRTIRCTTKSDYINQNNLHPTGTGPNYTENQIRCVDVDINEWRSFLVDSVQSFKIIE